MACLLPIAVSAYSVPVPCTLMRPSELATGIELAAYDGNLANTNALTRPSIRARRVLAADSMRAIHWRAERRPQPKDVPNEGRVDRVNAIAVRSVHGAGGGVRCDDFAVRCAHRQRSYVIRDASSDVPHSHSRPYRAWLCGAGIALRRGRLRSLLESQHTLPA